MKALVYRAESKSTGSISKVQAKVAFLMGLHAHNVVTRVNVENLSGDTAG